MKVVLTLLPHGLPLTESPELLPRARVATAAWTEHEIAIRWAHWRSHDAFVGMR